MKQPHTEGELSHTPGQQNTGNHRTEQALPGGSDKLGGHRVGAENVEPTPGKEKSESVETGTDVDRVSGTDGQAASTKPVAASKERHPERDEFGHL